VTKKFQSLLQQNATYNPKGPKYLQFLRKTWCYTCCRRDTQDVAATRVTVLTAIYLTTQFPRTLYFVKASATRQIKVGKGFRLVLATNLL